ncbi:hypothetical protein BDW60DRAFT_208690 [Aspergillus nidulans var. acristatus]
MTFRLNQSTAALRVLAARAGESRAVLPSVSLRLRTITTTPKTPSPSQAQTGMPSGEMNQIEILERTILRPERAESTCSGTDNAVGFSAQAYDPSTTTPESEFACFEEEIKLRSDGSIDPLFISPANPDYSKVLARELDGRAVERDKLDRLGATGSVRGWVNKGKEVKVRVIGKEGKEIWRKMRMGMGYDGDEYERLLRGLRRLQMRGAEKDKGTSQKGA